MTAGAGEAEGGEAEGGEAGAAAAEAEAARQEQLLVREKLEGQEVERQKQGRQEAAGEPPPYYWIDIFAVNQHTSLPPWKCEGLTDCPGCAAVKADMHAWATDDSANPQGFARDLAHTQPPLVLNEPWGRPRLSRKSLRRGRPRSKIKKKEDQKIETEDSNNHR